MSRYNLRPVGLYSMNPDDQRTLANDLKKIEAEMSVADSLVAAFSIDIAPGTKKPIIADLKYYKSLTNMRKQDPAYYRLAMKKQGMGECKPVLAEPGYGVPATGEYHPFKLRNLEEGDPAPSSVYVLVLENANQGVEVEVVEVEYVRNGHVHTVDDRVLDTESPQVTVYAIDI